VSSNRRNAGVVSIKQVIITTVTCFRKIFNVKSKDVVHECETEFGVSPVTDVIDIRKRKFIVKYDLSENLLCQLCKKCITKYRYRFFCTSGLLYCVSILSLV